MISVSISYKDLVKKLGGVKGRIISRVGLHKSWGAVVYRWVIENFETEGGKTEEGYWKPLAPYTLRMRKHGGSKILQDTGRLKTSYHFTADNESVVIGTPTKYSILHQFGGINERGRYVPARPMLPTKYDLIKKEVEEITVKYLRAGL